MSIPITQDGGRVGARSRRRGTPLAWSALPLFVLILVALIGPMGAKYGPEQTTDLSMTPPGGEHWFGTDATGFDVFSRVVSAARLDLLIAVVSVAVAFAIAAPLGAAAGYHRGTLDFIVMRAMDFLQSFPLFVLAMALVAVTGPSVFNLIVVLAFLSLPIFVRLVRTEVLALRSRAFVDAARVAGTSTRRILTRHIIPNAVQTALAQASTQVGWALLLTAGLTFVGAGVRPPTAEWGGMISDGSKYMITGDWWVSLFPGLALMFAVLAFSIAGDAVSGLLDVTRRRR